MTYTELTPASGEQYYQAFEVPAGVHPAIDRLASLLVSAARNQLAIETTSLHAKESLKCQDLLKKLAEVGMTVDEQQRDLAVDGILNGHMSRVQAADIIGVHQGTTARWVKEAITSQGAIDGDMQGHRPQAS